MNIREFRWIEYTIGKQHTDFMIKWEDLGKYREQNGDQPQFISRFMYDRDNPYCGPVVSNFYADFDCEENLKLAKAEAAQFVDVMCEYGVKEENLKIRFTGGKGFSVEVPFQCFNAEPGEFLPLIWKSMAEQLKKTHQWKTLDLTVYDRRRLWRLTNTKHDKTGLYKIPIRRYDLLNTSIDDIRKFALRPVPYGPYKCDVDEEFLAVPQLVELYELTRQKILQDLEEKQKKIVEFEIPSTFDPAKIWYCVSERIKRGIKAPGRRPTAFYIAVALKRLGATPEQIKSHILEFAKNCDPLLDPTEYAKDIDHAIESAFKHDYVTHCGTPCFAELCNKKECWLFTKKPHVKVFPPEILEKARERLLSPDLEEWTQQVYDELICREHKNRLVLHYFLLTGKMKNPKLKTIILVKGDPGGGKSHLADKISEHHKTKKRGRLSERALDYTDLKNYDILYLMEVLSMMGGEEGVSMLKFLGSDDEGYEVEITTKDKEGRFTTETYKIPAMTVLCTTTNVQIEKQFERRSVVINVDDSPEQTQAILAFKARKEIERAQEALGIRKPSENPQVLDAAISLLEDCEVPVLFPNTVKKLFEGEEMPLRVRGDYDKILTLIKMRAAYFQFQRPYTQGVEKKVVFALPEDFIKVLQFADEPILQMISGAEKRLRDALPFILQLKDNYVSVGKDQTAIGFTIDQLRKILKPRRHANTIRAILHELADLGIINIEKYGRRNVYSLAVDQAEVEKRVAGISTVQSAVMSLQSEAEKEFKTQFSTILQQHSREIVIPEFLKNRLSLSPECNCEIVDTKEKQPEAENQFQDITANKTGESRQPGVGVAGLEGPPSTDSTKNIPTYPSTRDNSDNQSNLSKDNRLEEEVIEDFEWKPGETLEEAMKRRKIKT